MSALLGEPFLLASYPLPSQDFSKSVYSSKEDCCRHIRVTSSSSNHGKEIATVTVQGDGIHILELSNMHATVSHTLGPAAFFGGPSVTRFNNSDSDASTTYVIMRTAPGGINMTERDKTIWKWRDSHSRRPEEQSEPKQSAIFPYRVADIWAPSSPPSHVIAISPSGDVMLSDEDLKVMSTKEVSYSQSVLLKSFVFNFKECAFLRQGHQPQETVVMCFTLVGSRLKLRIVLAQSTGELEEIAECDLGVHQDIISVSCDPTGYTSILSQRGNWQLFRLGHDSSGAVTVTSLDKVLSLIGLSPFGSASGGKWSRCQPTIISIGSSFVLLAGISGDDPPEVVLLLWDIQYSVVLATQKTAVPSTITYSSKSPIMIDLVSASKSHALMVISLGAVTTSKRATSEVPSRSTVLVVPLGVPSTSTVALAMGKARDTQKWLRNMHTAGNGDDPGRRQVVHSVRQALDQGRPQAAESTFFAWVEQETVRLQAIQRSDAPSNKDPGEKTTNDSGATSKFRRKNKSDKWKGPSDPHLSHRFVSKLLNVILRPSKPSDTRYPSKIVQYLIRRQAVSDSMIEGGLLPALRQHGDWDSIASALENVQDLSEDDISRLLLEVVKSHRMRQEPDIGGMQVGIPPDIPTLPSFLAMLVVYTPSPSVFRLGFKMHLTDARDIICIIEVLEGWLTRCDTHSDLVLDIANLPLDVEQASNPNTENKTPSLVSLVAFLQCVFDVHFLTLLQYPPSHRVIERILHHIHEQLLSMEDLNRLRGPLEAFSKTSCAQRRGEIGGASRYRRKEAALEGAELAIGLYQLEELII